MWQWVIAHPDVRIYHKREARSLTLAEFEALEKQDGSASSAAQISTPNDKTVDLVPNSSATTDGASQISTPLRSLAASLRQQLLAEGAFSNNASVPLENLPPPLQPYDSKLKPLSKVHEPRKIPNAVQLSPPAFEEPDASIQTPRLFVSQNRTWIAIAGHPIDLKKVPGSEFVLLSIIARAGPGGIAQPTLQKISGQDKRSIPERTNKLQAKGYIEKRPIQDGKARTSLCTHKMFLKDRIEEPQSVNDVFGLQTLSLTGLVFLLNKVLEATPVVQVRQLRTKMVGPVIDVLSVEVS